jgi:hypothetical protein
MIWSTFFNVFVQTVQVWRNGVVGVWTGYLSQSQARVLFCGFCGYASSKSTDVTMHVRVHTGEKPFPCRICGRDFRRKHHMAMHLFGVHGVSH